MPKLLLTLIVSALLSAHVRAAVDVCNVQSVVITLVENVNVATQDSGRIEKVLFHEGDRVQEGQVLAELDDADARLERQRVLAEVQIAQAEAAQQLKIELAEKALAVAAAELLRAEKSNDKYENAISVTELDKLRFTRDQAALQILHARHETDLATMQLRLKQAELEIAEHRIERRRLLAPISGVVVKIDRQRGEWIQAGETLVRIVNPNKLRAEGFVHVNDGELASGQKVTLSLPQNGKPALQFTGRVTFIDPEVNPITSQYRVWAEVDNSTGLLRPGQRPSMTIALTPVANLQP